MANSYIIFFIFTFALRIIFCAYLSAPDDDKWSAPQLIEREGYKCEIHKVTTEDGYILSTHRIRGNGAPILMVHGLLEDSALWLVTGKNRSLAYLLADEGYDIWLGNVRGNKYGMGHVNLSTDDPKFWNFSFHDMAMYDLPATIEFIQNSTNQQLIYIGHSQGTLTSFIMSIKRPEVANKLKILISLAPIAYLGHVWTEAMRFFILPLIIKYGEDALSGIIKHFPSGTSIKNMYHYVQGAQTDRFALYDYGEKMNLAIFNESTSPALDLRKINRPIALYYSEPDVFVRPEDRIKLFDLCPNIVEKYLVDHPGFTHMDFVWGKDAKELVYDRVIKLVNKYDKS